MFTTQGVPNNTFLTLDCLGFRSSSPGAQLHVPFNGQTAQHLQRFNYVLLLSAPIRCARTYYRTVTYLQRYRRTMRRSAPSTTEQKYKGGQLGDSIYCIRLPHGNTAHTRQNPCPELVDNIARSQLCRAEEGRALAGNNIFVPLDHGGRSLSC